MRLFAFIPRRTLCSPPSGSLPARYLALASGKLITGRRYTFPRPNDNTGLANDELNLYTLCFAVPPLRGCYGGKVAR